MEKFTGFTKEHVGAEVAYISKRGMFKGKITTVDNSPFGVTMKGINNHNYHFNSDGLNDLADAHRTLYFGHNIKVEVTGEEVPEPKLICPVCGVEHELKLSNGGDKTLVINNAENSCPLYTANFTHSSYFNLAMKNLIKAMEPK